MIGQQLQNAFAIEVSPLTLVQRIKCHFMDIIRFVLTLDLKGLASYLARREKLFITYPKTSPSFIKACEAKASVILLNRSGVLLMTLLNQPCMSLEYKATKS